MTLHDYPMMLAASALGAVVVVLMIPAIARKLVEAL